MNKGNKKQKYSCNKIKNTFKKYFVYFIINPVDLSVNNSS